MDSTSRTHDPEAVSSSSELGDSNIAINDDDESHEARHLNVEETLRMWNLARIIRELGNHHQCVSFAEATGLIPVEKICRKHRKPMAISASANRLFGSWLCRKRTCKDKSKVSRANGTFFENVKINLEHVFYLIYAFSQKWNYDMVMREDPWKDDNKKCLSQATICNWYSCCRQVIVIYYTDKTQTEEIESQWKAVERYYKKHQYKNSKNVEDAKIEYLWRRNIMQLKKDPFVEILNAIKYVYKTK